MFHPINKKKEIEMIDFSLADKELVTVKEDITIVWENDTNKPSPIQFVDKDSILEFAFFYWANNKILNQFVRIIKDTHYKTYDENSKFSKFYRIKCSKLNIK